MANFTFCRSRFLEELQRELHRTSTHSLRETGKNQIRIGTSVRDMAAEIKSSGPGAHHRLLAERCR
jgi:hypothetical protein